MKKTILSASLLMLCAWPALADESALSFGASNTLDLLGNLQGGLRTGTRALDKLDLNAAFAGDQAGWDGWDASVDLQWTYNNDFSGALVGDSQVVSNIDAPQGVRVLEAWISRQLSDAASLKFGIIDLNSEFDVQGPGVLFLNSSHGVGVDFSQSGQNGPSIFPSTGLGLVGTWNPSDNWDAKAGLFEGTPGNPAHPGRTDITLSGDEGALLTFETRYHFSPQLTVGLGGWHYTAEFAQTGTPGMAHANTGVYSIVEATLWGQPDAGPHLDGWLRAGLANARINPVRSYVGGGLVYFGPFGRPDDQAGIAVAHAMFGAPARLAGGLTSAETTIEATYAMVWNEWVTLQPDFQYVVSPGGDPALKNAVVAGARLILSWQ